MRRGRLAFLIAAQTLFFWMFLSADPLEQLAETFGSRAEAVMHFAARWRHGMAGNSPLYLPGFFMTAAAVWLYAAAQPKPIAHARDAAIAAIVSLGAAAAFAPWGAEAVVRGFHLQIGVPAPPSIPRASVGAAMTGGYTLLTWSAFIACARASLVRRSLYPLLLPAALTIGLVLVRPWTAGDFTSYWALQVVDGDGVAWVSLLSAIGLGAIAARTTRRPAAAADAVRQSRAPGSR